MGSKSNQPNMPNMPNKTGPMGNPTGSEQPDDTKPDPTEPGSVALGDECKEDKDCKSKICRVGVLVEEGKEVKECASCRDDAQCIAEKKGFACKVSLKTGLVECVDGKIGSPCDKKEQCTDNLMCALINMGDNKSEERTCSECEKHTDCPAMGNRNCVSRDTAEVPGYFNKCLPDKVRENGEICFPCETGNRECAGGFCVKVDLKDDPFCIGVCGHCNSDVDCPKDHRCEAPKLNFEGKGLTPHTPSKCVKK